MVDPDDEDDLEDTEEECGEQSDRYVPEEKDLTVDLTDDLNSIVLQLEDSEGVEHPYSVNFMIEIEGVQYAELLAMEYESSVMVRIDGEDFTPIDGDELNKVLSSIN